MLLLHCLERFELCFYCKYSRSYESVYNLAYKSFEIAFRKQMLFIKQYELLQKIPIHGSGCKVFTVLCSLGKLADSTLSIYMIKKGVAFNSDHLENSLITSQNVMDFSIGIIFFQAFLEFYIHPPALIGTGYRMKQPNILRKLVHSAGRR